MFRSPTFHSTADEEAPSIGKELTTLSDAQEAASKKTTPASIAPHDSPSQALKRPYDLRSARRNSHHAITDLPRRKQTSREIEAMRDRLYAAQQRPYEPSRAAHTIPPFHSVHVHGLHSLIPSQLPKTDTTPIARPVLLSPFALPLSTTDMEILLLPVKVELGKLKGTTLPPANSRIHAKSAMQVLKERLLPVGKFIVLQSASLGEARGTAEYEICKFIADYYWPQRLVRADALRIMEMYRNTMFLDSIEGKCEVEDEVGGSEIVDGSGFLFEDTEDDEGCMPGLVERAPWQPHRGGMWRPVDLEEDWECESRGTGGLGEEVGYEGRDGEPWSDQICREGDVARGG